MPAYLSDEQIDTVRDAAIAQFMNPMDRPLLFDGVMPNYVSNLPIHPVPAYQIASDLMRMNADGRLINSSVPLQQWLHNAARMTLQAARRAIFDEAYDEVSAKSAGMPDLGEAGDVSDIKEAIVFTDDTVDFDFLSGGTAAGESVGRLVVRPYENGQPRVKNGSPESPHAGTGWLITPSLLMTNHHVITARDRENGAIPMVGTTDLALQAGNSVVTFDYNSDDDDGSGVDAHVSELLAASPQLDYAIVRLTEDSGRKPLRICAMPLTASLKDNIAVNVIQHPGGREKRVGLRNNIVYDAGQLDLRYFTDTRAGSSGAPVFTDQWEVCALHRGAKKVKVPFQGKTSSYLNVGTQITAVLADLKVNFPDLHKEICG